MGTDICHVNILKDENIVSKTNLEESEGEITSDGGYKV